MIRYLKGAITHKSPNYIIVEAGGIGYEVNISLMTYGHIEPLEQVKISTYLHIKEDSHTLYGFASEQERKLFLLLISVSGIGPSTAQLVLSSMNVEEVSASIVNEDEKAFNRVKGVGPKTAKRIILDLKDKVEKEFSPEKGGPVLVGNNPARTEAIAALTALGFNRISIQKSINKIIKESEKDLGVEELIKTALKHLS